MCVFVRVRLCVYAGQNRVITRNKVEGAIKFHAPLKVRCAGLKRDVVRRELTDVEAACDVVVVELLTRL